MKIDKNDVMWGYISLILVQSINIILLPFILKFLSKGEVGLWYTFTTFYSLAILIDFGFQSVISRNVSYLWAGANEILDNNISKNIGNVDNKFNELYFFKFLSTAKYIYKFMSLIVFTLMGTIGTYYIYIISIDTLPIENSLIAWIFYFIAIVFNIYFSFWNAFIRGIGAIKKYNQILIITKIAQLFITILLLSFNFGIIGVSLAYLISVVINRILQSKAFYNYNEATKNLKSYGKSDIFDKDLFKKLLPNTSKTAILSFSNYLIINFPILLCSYYLSLEISGEFGFLNQIITLILTFSNSYFNTYLSKINYLRAKNEHLLAKKLFIKSININFLINIILFLLVILVGNLLLSIIGSNILLPSMSILLVTIIYRYLYNNQTLFTTFISTTNNLYYYKYFFVSALITVILQFLMVNIFNDIKSIIIPLLVVQLLFNNWYWVYKVLKELRGEKNVYYE